ncbi:uncharacterized protein LOC110029848 [Phalaenopsis equestris]|uniref:uncharacterized protein LOC110029848 n=1 Tax=Phalaenopsis equestris TaxID=78828 RepID=UPI0009E5CB30|nr:uncharacterized protein LOC110029848 [Phalaenopsis equestris]
MVSAKFTSFLLLWMLLSSLALRDSIGSAQDFINVDTEAFHWDKTFYVEAEYRGGERSRGRRMGAMWKGEEEEKSRRIRKTGNAKKSQNKQLRPSNNNKEDTKSQLKTEARGPKPVNYSSFPHSGGRFGTKEAQSVSHGATDQFQKMKAEKDRDAVAEVYNMMAKDYHTKAKSKPPINNNEQFDEEP